MRGRKPKPEALRALNGNAGKRAMPDGIKPPVGLPAAPAHLDEVARKAWADVGGQLVDLGLMAKIYGGQLALYCVAWSRWVDAEQKLRTFGTVIMSPNKFPVQSPYLSIANKAMEQMQRYLVEFGMSPSSAARVKVAGEAPADELEAWLGGKVIRGGKSE